MFSRLEKTARILSFLETKVIATKDQTFNWGNLGNLPIEEEKIYPTN